MVLIFSSPWSAVSLSNREKMSFCISRTTSGDSVAVVARSVEKVADDDTAEDPDDATGTEQSDAVEAEVAVSGDEASDATIDDGTAPAAEED